MMNELLQTRVVESFSATTGGANGPVVLTTTGDKFVFAPKAPIRVLKWGFLINAVALDTTGANLIMALDHRPTAGSDTNRAEKDTLTIAATNVAYTLGKGAYRDPYVASTVASTPSSMPSGGGPLGFTQSIASGQQQITVKPGEELVIEVKTGAGAAGQGQVFIEYEVLPISKPSGYGTTDAGTVSLTENYTRVAS